ncbi:MAG: hypothetical protein H0X37_25795 [Herpetosiphonaceae bacterium]|nr:hypothetical protein [Herpetosiphonaceae bacterium]
MVAVARLCHVRAAMGGGPICTLPLLANAPAAVRAVLILLRFGAGLTLVSGIALWVVLKPVHPSWLSVSLALFLLIVAAITLVIYPTANAVSEKPELRRRMRWAGIAASGLTLSIGARMVSRPNL